MAIRKRGEMWLATVFRGYEPLGDGRRKRLEHSKSFRLKKDAEKWQRDQVGQVETGTWVKPSEMTLREYLKQWRAGALALGSQSDRTKASYRELLANYIEPKLGNVRLDRLTKSVVQMAAAELIATPRTSGGKPITTTDGSAPPTLSPTTVRRALAALGVALSDAVEKRLMLTNPAQGISLPRAPRNVPTWLTRDEANKLIDATVDDRHHALWVVLVSTGMRPGEALALTWDEVDLTASDPVVRIRQSLVPQNKKLTGTTWKLEDPKTDKSRRAVQIGPRTVRALKALRAQQAAERLAAGEEYHDYGFVFAHPTGDPYREDALMQLFHRTTKRLGLAPVTLYGLRHSHASQMQAAGVSPKVIQERLGHHSAAFTMDVYAHGTDDLQRWGLSQYETYMDAVAKEAGR
jgi:integrase